MKIEEGKFYRTRDGRKMEPVYRDGSWTCTEGYCWLPSGRHCSDPDGCPFDLIAEWNEGPVREVTRKEIVPGEYGRIKIASGRTETSVPINILPSTRGFYLNAAELRAAAATLTEIADALESP
jgi:hypothetical protein